MGDQNARGCDRVIAVTESGLSTNLLERVNRWTVAFLRFPSLVGRINLLAKAVR